jgi:uncharacterized membrane protein required for colicin V production
MDAIRELYNEALISGVENVTGYVVSSVVEPMARGISVAVAFVLVFIVASIVLKIVVRLVNSIFKLPGLNFINKMGGLALGAVCAFIYVLFFITFSGMLLEALYPDTMEGIVESTLLYRQFSGISLF